MDRYRKLAVLAPLLVGFGCPSGPHDPLPREETTELASAAPRALGALAGGTDAAPPAVFAPRPTEEPDGVLPEFEADAGVEQPDAAAVGTDELPL